MIFVVFFFLLSGRDQCFLDNAGVCYNVYLEPPDVILLAQCIFSSRFLFSLFAPSSDLTLKLFIPLRTLLHCSTVPEEFEVF